jgi:hypothetical protein
MEDEEDRDPWLSWVPMLLYGVGGLYFLLGVGSLVMLIGAGGLAASAGTDDGAVMLGVMVAEALVIAAVTFGFGAVNIAGGYGFGQKAKWGWFTALILGGMYAPSACLPFGIAILYGCLNERTRKTFIG